MKRVLTVLFATIAISAFALPRVKVANILAMDADEIAACGKCELEVQVTFNIPWVENAFVATDVGDVDGHALYFATFTEPQPGKFDMVEPGDIVRVVGAPDPMLLEPGIDVESVKIFEKMFEGRKDKFVKVSFRMTVGTLIDSVMVQLYPMDFALEMIEKFKVAGKSAIEKL